MCCKAEYRDTTSVVYNHLTEAAGIVRQVPVLQYLEVYFGSAVLYRLLCLFQHLFVVAFSIELDWCSVLVSTLQMQLPSLGFPC